MWPHAIFQCYLCDKKRLTDPDFIEEMVRELAEITGLHIEVIRSKHFKVPKENKKGNKALPGGVSCTAIISESHISVHTWPEFEYVDVDIYACKQYDKKIAERFVRKRLAARFIEVVELERGAHIGFLQHKDRKKFPEMPPRIIRLKAPGVQNSSEGDFGKLIQRKRHRPTVKVG